MKTGWLQVGEHVPQRVDREDQGRASPVSGRPHADRLETSAAAWFAPPTLAGLPMLAPVRAWIRDALAPTGPPHVD